MLDYAKYSVLSYSRQSSEAVRIARLPFLHAHLRQLVVRKALNPFVSRFESEDGHTLMPHTMRGLMTNTISHDMITELKQLASDECWTDGDDFMVDDYAGGNMDDAFAGGERAGEVHLARRILDSMGIEY